MPNELYSTIPGLILGFHGCDREVAEAVLAGECDLKPSENGYDWLGAGIYFWENDYERALTWASESRFVCNPAVVGAVLDLGYCLDLLEYRYLNLVKDEYEFAVSEVSESGIHLRRNEGPNSDKVMRYLDYYVIEHLMDRLEGDRANGSDLSSARPFDSVRGLFPEGSPLFPGAGIGEKTHIQIAIRNPNCIKGYFRPRSLNANYPIP